MQKKTKILVLVIVLVVLGIAAYLLFKNHSMNNGTTNPTGSSFSGKYVTVDYIGKYESGEVFDTSLEDVAKESGLFTLERQKQGYTPLGFVVGAHKVIPGFENAVEGMKIGETKTVTIPPKEAYGEYNSGLVISMQRSAFQDANIIPKVGDTYSYGGGVIKVLEVTPDTVKVDANSPMAGKTLIFDITLKSISAE